MLGQTFRTPSHGERLARNPMKAVLAPLSFPARRDGVVRLPLGTIIYPISIALVAAATVGVFFGLGFCLMVQRPAAGAYGEAQAASSAATPIPVDATRPPVAPATPMPVARAAASSAGSIDEARGRSPIFAASGPPAVVGAASSGIADRASGSAVALARMAPPDTATAQQAAKPSAAPPAVAQASSSHLSAAEIGALLAHGNAAFRKGDIAAARLLFQRAADAGEGRAALGMGATYDPTFLRLSPLRILYGDPAEARTWYLHALVLGAAGAERRLINLQARAAR
jgi:hypothetical protein